MDNIKLRKAGIEEVKTLQFIGKETFRETFEAENSKENMAEYLKDRFDPDKLRTELSNKDSEFYFAEIQEQVIGYLKTNFGAAQTEIKDNQGLEIERIYVLKEYQKRRVGQLLFEKALEIAKEKRCEYVWLGVWEKNIKAINFYKKNGFIAFDKHIFKLGDDKQTDIMMKLKL